MGWNRICLEIWGIWILILGCELRMEGVFGASGCGR